MLEEIYEYTKDHMEKSIDSLKREFTTLRTGKVSTKILDRISINYYGTPTPLNGVATISTPDASTITIAPWEKKLIPDIEKAVNSANIGVNPSNNGEAIILPFPPMTKEQRQETVKSAKVMSENAKVAVRNVRRDGNDKVKKLEKDKQISEDDGKKAHDEIQKITDLYIAKVEETLKQKENEILKV